MAGRTRHLKEKGGRFYARLAVPKALQPHTGKTELLMALGGDRREAVRQLPQAVANLQAQLETAPAVGKGDANPLSLLQGHALSKECLAVGVYKQCIPCSLPSTVPRLFRRLRRFPPPIPLPPQPRRAMPWGAR
ncbi:DUF6538 domain-containing protein [Salipiger marinus]|uniref:DUF6538 domain-containing protein n=1 Tax=Salipiger marinus TaxID=555512 RepID=UPI00405A0E4E